MYKMGDFPKYYVQRTLLPERYGNLRMYALSRLVYANIRGENTQSRWYNGNVRGSKTSIWGKYQRGGCNSEPDSRMFYKADGMSSGRSSATELVPISGDLIKSSGRSLHFTCNALEQGR
jgi:hypothetical protein